MKITPWLWRIYWAAYAIFQGLIFSRISLDYFDAFDYLRNARRLAGADVGYQVFKPPLMACAHAPLQAILDAAAAGSPVRLAAPHLLQCVFTLACLACVYRYLLLFFPEAWAQAGTVLLSLNRMVIHYFGFVLGDIPSALALTLFLYFLSSERVRRRYDPALGAAALACCLISRWNMLAAPPLALAGALAAWLRRGAPPRERRILRGWAAVCFAGLILAVAACLQTYRSAVGINAASAWRLLGRVLSSQHETQASAGAEPFWTYGESFLLSAGPVVLLAALLGLALCARKDQARHLPHGVFLLGFLVIMSFGLAHKESRYMIPVLPLFYALAVLGLRAAYERIHDKILRRLGVLVLVVSVASGAFSEWLQFQDPVYRSSALFDAAGEVKARSGPASRIVWTGTACAQVPLRHEFSPRDLFYYIYHVPSAASLEYFLGRPVYPAAREDPRPGDLLVRAPESFFTGPGLPDPARNRLTLAP